VEDAAQRQAELVVLGARRRAVRGARTPVFGGTVRTVLKESPTRVLVTAGKKAA
jgi:nucleotide-binding universal stress UspA family protein